jgi:phosphatidylglycerophosphate synthase
MALGEAVPDRRRGSSRAEGGPRASDAAAKPAAAAATPSSGRPPEIEDWSNFRVVHPLSRALVNFLIPTAVTPNMVSALGVVMAAAAAASYTLLPWPFCAPVGFVFHIAWHVFDGADGDLARRTGKSSTIGELVDGVCDYLSHMVLYAALGLFLSRQSAPWGDWDLWALPVTVLAAASNAWQANAYESGRRNYWRWVYGRSWIKHELAAEASRSPSGLRRILFALGHGYLAASALLTPDERPIEAVLARLLGSSDKADAARALYRAEKVPMIKRSSWLGENHKTMILFASMLLGTPLWYLLYVGVVLNVVLALNLRAQTRSSKRLAARLDALEAGAA